MKHPFRPKRLLALLLVVAMVTAILPASALAAGTTIIGSTETVPLGADAAANRENDFNKGWKFFLGDHSDASNPGFDDSAWESVNLPHDFSITQSFTSSGEAESGFLAGGTGWYRKSVVLSEEHAGKTFLLNFDGVYMNAYVYVNGTFVGEHHYGYTSFAFDITEHLVCDGFTENVIAVKAVNNIPTSRWYSGSGIYRDVTLYALDPIHVDLNGITVTTPQIADGSGAADVTVNLVNNGAEDVEVQVSTMLYAKGSDVCESESSATVTIGAGGTAAAAMAPAVSDPALWSVENPNLYTAVVELTVDGQVVDRCET